MTLLSRRCLLAVALVGVTPLRAQNAAPSFERRLAIRGYDPVAYFTEGRATKGRPEFASDFDDVTYWFASAQHRDMFVADPDKYAPQFGGLCAVMMSQGKPVDPDPEAWTIADGKLYLFRAKEGVPFFQQQAAGILRNANENWPRVHRSN